MNIIQAKEALLTDQNLALVLEFAAGGSLTNFVTDKWQEAQKQGGLFCTESEARYFFRVHLSLLFYMTLSIALFLDIPHSGPSPCHQPKLSPAMFRLL